MFFWTEDEPRFCWAQLDPRTTGSIPLKQKLAVASQRSAVQEAKLSAILNDAVERARSITSADGAALALQDSKGIQWRASLGNAPAIGSPLQPDSGFTWKCFATGQVMLCSDAENDPRVGLSTAKKLGLSSLAAVPLRFEADGSILGVVEVFSARPLAFDASQVESLIHLAQSVALRLASERNEPNSTVFSVPAISAPAPLRIVGTAVRTAETPLAENTPEPAPALEILAPRKDGSKRFWIAAGTVFLLFLLITATFVFYHQRLTPSSSDSAAAAVPATPAATSNPTDGASSVPKVVKPPTPEGRVSALTKNESANQTPYADAGTRERIPDTENPAAPNDSQLAVKHPILLAQEPRPNRSPTLETKLSPPDLEIAPNLASGPDLALHGSIPVKLAPNPPPEFTPQRNFQGHSSWVTAVAFNANGTELASASWDRSVKLWALPSGEESTTVTRKMKEIQTLAFSPDGRLLATENSSNTITLWDANSGREVLKLPGNKPLGLLGTSWVYSIAFSPNSRWLASGLDEKTIRVWDVETGLPVRDLAGDRRSVLYVAFSPDGHLLASGADDKTIDIWDLTSGKVLHTLKGHSKNIHAVAFSGNGRWLASASADKTVKLWDVASGREIHTLTGHGSSVASVAFSPDSRWLASGSWDKTVKIWDVEKGQLVETLAGNTNPVYSVAFDPLGHWLASGSQDGTIRLWRAGK
jgi:WD40 repeat protein